MKAVIAIDSFKGCLGSAEAAAAVAEGLDGCDCVVLPVSDGGEGFAAVLTAGSSAPAYTIRWDALSRQHTA